ncbi:hypothetical protein ACHAXS_012810 [Conticribra weissflogii]
MSETSKRAKVLMVGPVNGQLRLLSDKLRTLQNSKAGPFDVCLCAGPFFFHGEGGERETEEERDDAENAAAADGAAVANGSLSFDVPVIFVDPGGGPPEGLAPKCSTRSLASVKDDDEIDLDADGDQDGNQDGDQDGNQDGNQDGDPNHHDVPDGLRRLAPNLYRLVGGDSSSDEGTADIVALPLPLPSDSTTTAPRREHPVRLAVGFLPPKVRLPCPFFERKAKHTSFLGCDVLISTEWGQGMSSSRCGALAEEDRRALADAAEDVAGSYDVAELVAASRPRYHLAPGPRVPVPSQGRCRRRFVASLPYRYPGASSHAGRFLAVADVASPAEFKSLGKQFKFVHAVGIVPLAAMDANERDAAREAGSAVDCPYTDDSYDVVDDGRSATAGNRESMISAGGLSEARARRIAQEEAAMSMGGGAGSGGGGGGGGGGHDGGAYRWQMRPARKRPRGDDGGGDHDDDEAKQASEEDNPDNRSLFLHGLHRDPGMTLTVDVLMDAFRPFGCVAVRFPKPKMNRMGQTPPSYAFLDFTTHEEASQCLADLKGEAVIRNIMLTLKWSSSPNAAKRQSHGANQPLFSAGGGGGAVVGIGMIPPPPPPPKRRNRITEAEAADSTTLFLRLPPSLDSSSYPKEFETMRLLAQTAMEDELNTGVPPDAADRITAEEEPALRVTVRRPNDDMNYGHAAALTTLVALTGQEDGGAVSEEKLAAGLVLAPENGKDGHDNQTSVRTNVSHLSGVTLFWAKGAQPKSSSENDKNYGLSFNKRHFPPDSRTDCWFCLASPTCEKHLIIAVYQECYITMPKGAVNQYHSLIVPVEHGGDGALVNRKIAPEIESVKSKLRIHARTVLQKDLFVFERCIETKGGYHTHVQCIPVDADSGPAIQSKMLEMAIRAGFQLKEITSDLGLNALEDDWSNGYFYAEIPLPGGGNEFRRFIYRAGEGGGANGNGGGSGGGGGGRGHVPLQFGREVLAEVMGKPDVAQWKACVVNQEKEEEMTVEFRKSLETITC